MPRDSQRGRVYAAERELWVPGPRSINSSCAAGGRLETIAEVQAFVDRVCQSPWYARTFPRAHRRTTAAHGGGNSAARSVGIARIEMPAWARCRLVVLHEMAHCIVSACHPGEPWHGRAFCRTYLSLVERWLGADTARALRAAFRKHRVRWCQPRPGAKAPPGNAERLARWREQRQQAAASPRQP